MNKLGVGELSAAMSLRLSVEELAKRLAAFLVEMTPAKEDRAECFERHISQNVWDFVLTLQPTPSPATDVDEVAKIIMCELLGVEWQKAMPELSVTQLSFIKQSLLTYGEKLRGEVEELSQVIDKTSDFIEEKFGIKGEHGYMFILERIAKERQDLQSANESLRKENETQALLIKGLETTQAFLEKENEGYEDLIVRKDEALKRANDALLMALNNQGGLETGKLRFPRPIWQELKAARISIQEALSPTISSSLVEDKERLDWYHFFYTNPDKFTIGFCEQFYKDRVRLGIREAIDAARNSSKSNL